MLLSERVYKAIREGSADLRYTHVGHPSCCAFQKSNVFPAQAPQLLLEFGQTAFGFESLPAFRSCLPLSLVLQSLGFSPAFLGDPAQPPLLADARDRLPLRVPHLQPQPPRRER